mmetsp:Transcript_19852/g.79171  ORF Transcript_19852/g.79171 Transcript_19852/m.79171 type:complete len:188 (+) Transcript_19852:2066-2629(+)
MLTHLSRLSDHQSSSLTLRAFVLGGCRFHKRIFEPAEESRNFLEMEGAIPDTERARRCRSTQHSRHAYLVVFKDAGGLLEKDHQRCACYPRTIRSQRRAFSNQVRPSPKSSMVMVVALIRKALSVFFQLSSNFLERRCKFINSRGLVVQGLGGRPPSAQLAHLVKILRPLALAAQYGRNELEILRKG